MSILQTFRDGGYRPYYGWKRVFARIWLTLVVVAIIGVCLAAAGWKPTLIMVGACATVVLTIYAAFVA